VVGTSPFHRSSDVAILNAHLHDPPPKLTRAAPDLPSDLEAVLSKALSKSPLDRFGSCGEFVAAVRAASSERRVHHRRLALSLAVLTGAAVIGAAIALAVFAVVRDEPAPRVTTVTVKPLPAPSPVALDTLVLKSTDGRTLNDAAFYLINAKEYARAIPFARRAVRYTEQGTVTRAYATFNLGFSLLKVGQCKDALPLLKRALKLESAEQRPFITPRVKQAQACLRGGASGPAP
jgi:tetratricopeptide (TPR) repeat protein